VSRCQAAEAGRQAIIMFRIVSLASMTIGGSIYILWRQDSLTVFAWLKTLGVFKLVRNVRGVFGGVATALPEWVSLSLPQGLWVFSGCMAVHSIWRCPYRWQQRLWMFLILCLSVSGELGQATGLVPGVFDLWDLAIVFIAFLVAQLLTAMDVGPGRCWRV